MSDSKGIRITVEDLDGLQATTVFEIKDTYFIVEHGNCTIDGFQTYANGTHVITVKKAVSGGTRAEQRELAGN